MAAVARKKRPQGLHRQSDPRGLTEGAPVGAPAALIKMK